MLEVRGRPHRLRRLCLAVLSGTTLAVATAWGTGTAMATQAPAHPQRSCGIPITVHWHGRTYHLHNYGRFGIYPEKGHRVPVNQPAVARCKAPTGAKSSGPLNYRGGPLELNPRVYLDFFGSQWNSDSNGVEQYMQSYFQGVGTQPQDNWSTIMTQYTDSNGNAPSFGGSVLGGVWVDTSQQSPSNASDAQLQAEAQAAANHFGVSGPDVDIFVLSPSGTHPGGFNTPGGGFCAYHGFNGNVAYTNQPYVLDLGGSCGANSVRNQLDGFSITAGHEYAEAVTDPEPASGYVASDGSEIGDLCAWQNLFALQLSTGSFATQPLWSNQVNGCAQSGGSRSTGQITGINRLCVDVRSSNTSNGTPIQIWTCNGTGAQSWTVASDDSLQALGKCMDVTFGGTSDGTKVQLWDCNRTGSQVWRQGANGSLVNPQSGKCLDDPGSSTSPGTQLQIWDCNGTNAQDWTLP